MSKGSILVSILIVSLITISRLNDPNGGLYLLFGGLIILFLFSLLVWGIVRSHTPSTGRAILLMLLCILFPPVFFILLILWALGFDREAREKESASKLVTQIDPQIPQASGNLILHAVARYEAEFTDESVSLAPQINQAQLQNAVKAYASEARSVVLLVDSTLSRNGKEGLVIAAEGIFIKETLESPRKILVDDIHHIEAEELGSNIQLRINGRKFGVFSVAEERTRKALIDMLNSITG